MKLSKQIFFGIVSFLLLFSCTENNEVSSIIDPPQTSNTVNMRISSVAKAIEHYVHSNHPVTRGESIQIIPVIIEGDTVMNIVNHAFGGFEVFSNDFHLPMVLVKSKVGTFDGFNIPLSDPFHSFMYGIAQTIHEINLKSEQTENVDLQWYTHLNLPVINQTKGDDYEFVGIAVEASTKVFTPKGGRLKTKWHQRYPYNNYAQHCYKHKDEHVAIGCGAVAIGQYLKYINSQYGIPKYLPESAEYDAQENRYYFNGETEKDWDLIDEGSGSLLNNSAMIDKTALFLGSIASKIGRISSYYDCDHGIGSYDTSERDYINKALGTKYSFVDFSIEDAEEILKSGYPVYTASKGDETGHSHIIDYLESVRLSYYEVYAKSNSSTEDIEFPDTEEYGPNLEYYSSIYGDIRTSYQSSEKIGWVSMNWGWGGLYDDILYNATFPEWVVKDSSGTFIFNKNQILK